jgi:hypothetical protein
MQAEVEARLAACAELLRLPPQRLLGLVLSHSPHFLLAPIPELRLRVQVRVA